MTRPSAILLYVLCTQAALSGQAITTSSTKVIVSPTLGGGGTTSSQKHELLVSFGDGVPAGRATSARYVIEGGCNARLGVVVAGSPTLAAVAPRYATLRGGASLTLHGSELASGTVRSLKIGGKNATVGSRRADQITTVLPNQSQPGWQPVEFVTSTGTTVLAKGVGVLPLIETRPAAASGVPFRLVFKGSKGDGVIWALGIGASSPISFSGMHYGFALNPSLFIVLPGFGIADPNGELRMAFPATAYPTGTIYVQGLFVTTNPGYGPASFTNVLRL